MHRVRRGCYSHIGRLYLINSRISRLGLDGTLDESDALGGDGLGVASLVLHEPLADVVQEGVVDDRSTGDRCEQRGDRSDLGLTLGRDPSSEERCSSGRGSGMFGLTCRVQIGQLGDDWTTLRLTIRE